MRYLLLLLLLISCSAQTPLAQKLDNMTIPQQYIVRASGDGYDVAYVVRDEQFKACQDNNGGFCSAQTIADEEYGKTLSDIASEAKKYDPTQEDDCFSGVINVCFDENGVLTSYENKGTWKIEYVR